MYMHTACTEVIHVLQYNSPSFSGHPQERPPFLTRPQFSLLPWVYLPVLLPLADGHLSNVGTIAGEIGCPYSIKEVLLYIVKIYGHGLDEGVT